MSGGLTLTSKPRVFISMPMRGKSDEQIQYETVRLTLLLELLGYEVADSLVTDMDGATDLPLLCLSKSIEVMSCCDVAFFAKGWGHARGCCIGHDAAVNYGLEAIYE